MNKSDIHVGAYVRVITDRWDAPAGTVARVESVGQAGVLADWCFTVEWLNRPYHYDYGRHRHTSLNLFEEDLQDFEVHTGPIVQPPGRIAKRHRSGLGRMAS